MAERQTALTPTREERRLGWSTPLTWSRSPFRSLQRMADEAGRTSSALRFRQAPPRSRWSALAVLFLYSTRPITR